MAAAFLPPAPRFCASAQLTDRGIVLGEGVVVAPMIKQAKTVGVLALDGREAEIFALLSLAQGASIRPNVLHGFHGVAKALAQGEVVGAMIRLAQIGLAPLRGPRDAEMLKVGADCLAKGFSPWAILQAAGIEGANVRLAKAEWEEEKHPRDHATGRFVDAGSDGATNSATTPDTTATSTAGKAGTLLLPASANALLANGAVALSTTTWAVAGGILALTLTGWIFFHLPQGSIEDGPSYWLPGVPVENSSADDKKQITPPTAPITTPEDPCQNDFACDDKRSGSDIAAPTSLQILHSDVAIVQNKSSLDYWSKKYNAEIIESLFNGDEPLILKRNGVVMNGNTRLTVLKKRGYEIDKLIEKIGKNNYY